MVAGGRPSMIKTNNEMWAHSLGIVYVSFANPYWKVKFLQKLQDEFLLTLLQDTEAHLISLLHHYTRVACSSKSTKFN